MERLPTVSAIIPTLNAEDKISDLLESLQSQTIAPCEIIVVDSESSDKTVSVATGLGAAVLAVKRKDFSHGGTRDSKQGRLCSFFLRMMLFPPRTC